MKTTFNASDVGKSFHTSTEGVTAKLVEFYGGDIPCFFKHSNGYELWHYADGMVNIPYPEHNVHPDRPVEEGRKEELPCMVCGKLFMSDPPKMCCSGRECECMGQPTEPIVCSDECYGVLINKNKVKTFTEKEVRKAIELARCPDLTEYKLGYLYTPEEIIKQLTPKG